MATVEVTVRGAGAFGLSVAWACCKAGARVRVIDPCGVANGASGGIVGALAPHVPEGWNTKKAFQLESLLMAQDWWARVERAGGQPSGYGRTGRLQPLEASGLALAQARAAQAQTLWQGRASWQVVRVAGAPFEPLSPSGFLIHDTLSARLHPRQACMALAAAIRASGGQITDDTGIADEGVVVWATGWQGLTEMTTLHNRLVGTGVKGQAVLLDHDARSAPQVFVDGLHIIPHADGTTAIGSTTESSFDAPDTTDHQCDALLEHARTALPALADAREISRWAGVRPRSRTRAPMLGHHPFKAGAFIANGGFKIGFGMAPLAAEKMADLVLNGRNTLPEEFAPDASL